MAMRPPGSVSRRVLFTAVAALGLHSLRASAGWGGHAHGQLDAAHVYVPAATWAVLLAGALVTGHFLVTLVAPPGPAPSSPDSRRRMLCGWCWTSLTLVFICVGQELLEHVWLTGALPPPDEALRTGGWTMVPLAVLVGAVVTGAAWGSDAALTLPFCPAQTVILRARAPSLSRRLENAHPHGREPLAGLPAGRAPPLVVVSL
jgi:hypothetical protein